MPLCPSRSSKYKYSIGVHVLPQRLTQWDATEIARSHPQCTSARKEVQRGRYAIIAGPI